MIEQNQIQTAATSDDPYASLSNIVYRYKNGADDQVYFAGGYKNSISGQMLTAQYQYMPSTQSFKLIQSETPINAQYQFPRKALDQSVYQVFPI